MLKEDSVIPDRPMDLDAFLDWAERTPGRWQLVDGYPVATEPAPPMRGCIHATVGALLANHLRATRPGWIVTTPCSLIPEVMGGRNIRVAHVGVYDHMARASVRYASDPVLVGDIVSPTNERLVWSNVWTYLTLPSVREVFVIQAFERRAEVLRRRADGTWPGSLEVAGEEVTLASVGMSFALRDAYEGTELADG